MDTLAQQRRSGSLVALAFATIVVAGCTGSDVVEDALPTVSSSTTTSTSTSTSTSTTTSTSTESETTESAPETTSAPADAVVPIEELVPTHVGCLTPVLDAEDEQWSFCRTTDGLELLDIQWTVDGVVYNELFALLDGTLAYASEATAILVDDEPTASWTVWYTIENGVVDDYSSLGLGPTELDDWDPQAILDRWAAREVMANEIRAKN